MADLEINHCRDLPSVNSKGPEEVREEESKLEFSEDEETLISRMYKLVGQRWSLIAGRIPGRSAEEIEKFWTSRYTSSSE
ncbi:hypothetical protein SAY87_030736 [Trapa incisa]|uniref:Uncharacterized protein n=2 Tax=Trapa TaxID=22665 RepID=A0AAN7LWJ8_TRANT|nr:hypothetical protein SAY87_030736 [Trapa incisa]KAK4786801.1 hypothetical protein SAY86_010634 [Trapa natans]